MIFQEDRWSQRYKTGDIPWELGVPREAAVRLFQAYAPKKCRVLDIGCGSGTHAFWLAENGYQVTAFDLSPEAIAIAEQEQRKRHTHIDFQVNDILQLNKPIKQFPVIFTCAVLNQMQEMIQRDYFAKNVAALCEKNGYWIDITPSSVDVKNIQARTGVLPPPFLTASQIVLAVEPFFAVVQMQLTDFLIVRADTGETVFNAWANVFKLC